MWPVTERGLVQSHVAMNIGCSRVVGHADPIFETRFQLGDYMALTSIDLKRIKLRKEAAPQGFINPIITRSRINDLKKEHAEKLEKELSFGPTLFGSDKSLSVSQWQGNSFKRMRKLAKHVPWELADSWLTHSDTPQHRSRDALIVRIDLLSVAESAIQRLLADTTTTITRSPKFPGEQHKTGKPGKRAALDPEIIQAQAEAKVKGLNANDAKIIWGILQRMSTDPESKSTRLRGNNRDGIQYTSGEGIQTYRYSALNKLLKPK